MQNKSPIISVIIRKFRESDKDAANEVLDRFEEALKAAPGFLGIRHDIPPAGGPGSLATVISFVSVEDLIAWEQSDARKNIVEELSHYIDGEVVKNRLWDLDALLGRNHPPRKWKAVLVLIFWVFVVGAFLEWGADSISPDFPAGFARYAFLLVINIVLNSYIFLPKSMAILHQIENKLDSGK